MAFPDEALQITFEIAPGADPDDVTTWEWVDVSEYVYARDGIRLTRGRRYDRTTGDTTSFALTLDNRDGRFTRRLATSPYYPDLHRNTPARLTIDAGVVVDAPETVVGFVREWPVSWDPSGRDCWVPITATGRLARLEQDDEIYSALKSYLLGREPVAYWPLEDAAGATVAANAVSGGQPMTPIGGSTGGVLFAEVEGPAGSLELAQFGAGGGLLGTVPAAGSTWTVACVFRCTSPGGNAKAQAFMIRTVSGTLRMWRVELHEDGVTAVGYDADGVAQMTFARTGFTPLDGAWHDIALHSILPNTPNTIRITLELDNNAAMSTNSTWTTGGVQSVTAEQGPGLLNVTDVALGHLAVYSSDTSLNIVEVRDGAVGDDATERFVRVVQGEADIPAENRQSPEEDPQETMGVQAPATRLDVARDCEAVDGGILYEDAAGAIVLAARNFLLDRATDAAQVALTLDYEAGDISDWDIADNDRWITNDATFTRPDGSSARVADAAHIAQSGRYSRAETVNVEADTQLVHQAGWAVYQGTIDRDRIRRLVVDFAANPGLWPQWRDDLGSLLARILIVNPPPQWPPDDLDLIVTGYTLDARPFGLTVALDCVPSALYQVVALDTEPFHRLAPVMATLAADTTDTATSLSVANGVVEDFEDADFVVDVTGSGWARSSTDAHAGTWSLRANTIADNGSTAIIIAVPAWAETVQFWFRVSSENGFDYFRFDIDGVEQFTASGAGSWTQSAAYSVIGKSSIRFRYTKDGTTSTGSDTAWVDDLVFAAGPLWTTDAGEMPIDVLVGGERMQITAISGSSSPQTFTVTRSTNTVVKAHAAGTDVALATPPILSM